MGEVFQSKTKSIKETHDERKDKFLALDAKGRRCQLFADIARDVMMMEDGR
jgi:hypothetical protein